MFDPNRVLIDALVDKLADEFLKVHGAASDLCSEALRSVGTSILEKVSRTDALYHNIHHTLLVTLVGQDILRGRRALGATVSPEVWLSFLVSLLCHDIGFVPGLCLADGEGVYASGIGDEVVALPPEATDAALAPYHVDRGILFVREQLAEHPLLDADAIAANIDRTRFPVPDDDEHRRTDDIPGLARAADLLAQAAEPHPRRRYPALFYEFEETGVNRKLGYTSPLDLHADFPRFYSRILLRYCADGMRCLEATAEGREWLANLESQLVTAKALDSTAPAP